MRFASIQYIWLLAFLPLMVFLLFNRRKKRKQVQKQFFTPAAIGRLLPDYSADRQYFQHSLMMVVIFILVISATGPQFGLHSKLRKQRGLDIVVAMDISLSMQARDISPDRLSRAKLELSQLIGSLKGDRIGLVVFAGQSFVQCPLTTDYASVRLFLNAVEPSMLTRQGTDLAGALEESLGLLERSKTGSKSRVIILLTDGEGHEGDPLEKAKLAKEKGVFIFAVGVGSLTGEPIPLVQKGGKIRGYKKDNQGNTVITRLNDSILKAVAETASGLYIHSVSGDLGISRVRRYLNQMEKSEHRARLFTQYEERFQYLLLPTLIILLAITWMPVRRRKTKLPGLPGQKGAGGKK